MNMVFSNSSPLDLGHSFKFFIVILVNHPNPSVKAEHTVVWGNRHRVRDGSKKLWPGASGKEATWPRSPGSDPHRGAGWPPAALGVRDTHSEDSGDLSECPLHHCESEEAAP